MAVSSQRRPFDEAVAAAFPQNWGKPADLQRKHLEGDASSIPRSKRFPAQGPIAACGEGVAGRAFGIYRNFIESL
jgi:hypothetical protein